MTAGGAGGTVFADVTVPVDDMSLLLTHHSTGMPFLDARADFREARRAYALARLGRWLTRRRHGSRPLTLTDAPPPADGLARLETVPLARIVGTVEPTSQFDARFRPASEVVRHRWERVALAHRKGIPLPPIELREGANGYYVIDGRHRVSVARSLGQSDIDAWVVGPSTQRNRRRCATAPAR